MTPRSNWRDLALCRQHDPELFFPIGALGPARMQEDSARQVCAACPVKQPCLEWAVIYRIEYGIWGGTTEDDRRRMRRRRWQTPRRIVEA